MYKSFVRWGAGSAMAAICGACLIIAAAVAHATGGYTFPRWLEDGGISAEHSPEFYWDIEIRKIAAPFKPAEKRAERLPKEGPDIAGETQGEQAARIDLADFKAALKEGRIKPRDPAQAEALHQAARAVIANANEVSTEALPSAEPSEFADYHQGAHAFHRGESHYAEARAIWEKLLQRPAEERHYRSVWAAFMIGKLALYAGKPEAAAWFQKTRELAKAGFADSLGLAADSYGWEAKSELEQGHPEQAARLYLTQLALGDDSALVSLKALVPDRTDTYGMMNFAPLPPENADEATLKKFEEEAAQRRIEGLNRAARDPLLRSITTIHVLATETVGQAWLEPISSGVRCHRWLEAIEQAEVKELEGAERLGWVAYAAGNYAAAERWLNRSDGASAAALWLKARLYRRAGQSKEAGAAMAQAWRIIRDDPAWSAPREEDRNIYISFNYGYAPRQSASGDLASLNLSRADFVSAFEIFFNGNLPEDAAFLAERVLNTDELKSYVDTRLTWTADDEAKAENALEEYPRSKSMSLRWLLGRRLVREDRYQEARPYLPAKYRAILDRYTAALAAGANAKLPKQQRARAWFDAALIARYDGMELMGTEMEPDGFVYGGAYPPTDIARERATATKLQTSFENDKEVAVPKPMKLYIPVTAEEKKRLSQHTPAPNKRFHYRHIAAALGWKAALLLPDQSDELADVLNTAGGWIRNDSRAADKYFQAIERRASKTAIGKAAGARHWFVDMDGPWSTAAKAARP